MRQPIRFAALAALSFIAVGGGGMMALSPAQAALETGARAPDFTAPAAQGGRRFTVSLSQMLRRGPVVIYFFPRAFTSGCTLESRAFAAAMPDFRAAGARVIGMSADSIEDLARFSVEECRSAFPMAQATPHIISGFDVALPRPGVTMTDRTSYVIGTDGRIAMVHSDLNHNDHVRQTLAAVRAIAAARRNRR